MDYADTASIPGWAFQSVQQVTAHGLMDGIDGKFCPTYTVSWGEAAQLLCKLETVYLNMG